MGKVSKKVCPNCGKEIGATGFNRHLKACVNGYKTKKYSNQPKDEHGKTQIWYDAMEARKGVRQNHKKIDFTCCFCDRTFLQKNLEYKSFHENHCKANPNKKVIVKHLTDNERKRLSDNMKQYGGYENGQLGGRGHRGYYKGIYCMSSWELAWLYYQLSNGKSVERCKEYFLYEMNGKVKKYFPDFIMDGVYYEVKNYNRPDTEFKVNQFPKDKKLVLILGLKEIKPYLDFVISKEGDNFWEKLYEKENMAFRGRVV